MPSASRRLRPALWERSTRRNWSRIVKVGFSAEVGFVPRPARYLAMVGSQRKALLTRERCLAKGIDAAQVERLVSPAGLDIGAETPEEIAVSIVAQMVHVRRAAEAAGRKPRGVRAQVAG